jgi:electron transport complex protein RnfC
MALKTFKRGVHLPERKNATTGKPYEFFPLPKQVVIPINQHFGAPNKSLVAIGDTVRRGQMIADAATPGPMTVPVHASISGIVKKIEVRTQSNNSEGLCIIIEADGAEVAGGDMFLPPLDAFSCTKDEALARIREAGLVGMGGAGFPVHIKLNPPANKPVDLLILDGAECEPYLTTDEAAIREKTDLLIEGLCIVMQITGVKKAIIGMEDNKAALVPVLENAIKKSPRGFNITVELTKSKYPQGGERMLITALTGKQVPSGGLPMDTGCIVQNVGTTIAIAEAFQLGKPLIERGLTVSGGACKTPKNIYVPIGTIITDFPADFMQIDSDKLRKIIFGGPMMGNAVPKLDIPIQKNTSGIILMTDKEAANFAETPCIRCGRCIKNCACFLTPVMINIGINSDDLEGAVKAGLMDCVECGTCAYVCPARIKLVQRFRVGKQRVRALQAQVKK